MKTTMFVVETIEEDGRIRARECPTFKYVTWEGSNMQARILNDEREFLVSDEKGQNETRQKWITYKSGEGHCRYASVNGDSFIMMDADLKNYKRSDRIASILSWGNVLVAVQRLERSYEIPKVLEDEITIRVPEIDFCYYGDSVSGNYLNWNGDDCCFLLQDITAGDYFYQKIGTSPATLVECIEYISWPTGGDYSVFSLPMPFNPSRRNFYHENRFNTHDVYMSFFIHYINHDNKDVCVITANGDYHTCRDHGWYAKHGNGEPPNVPLPGPYLRDGENFDKRPEDMNKAEYAKYTRRRNIKHGITNRKQ